MLYLLVLYSTKSHNMQDVIKDNN